MARRSDHTRDELRTMVIRAGQKIITRKGLQGFSARAVAREIGYTVGMVYHVFESHDDLILHINAVTLEELHEFVSARIKKHAAGVSGAKRLAKAYADFAETHYNRWSALFEYRLPADTELPAWYAEKIRNLFVLAEAPLLPLVNNNVIKAARGAKVLWAGIHGICELRLIGKLDMVKAESMQALMDSLIEGYCYGLEHGRA